MRGKAQLLRAGDYEGSLQSLSTALLLCSRERVISNHVLAPMATGLNRNVREKDKKEEPRSADRGCDLARSQFVIANQ